MPRKWEVKEIRRLLNAKFPDLNEPPQEEHAMTAVGVVLASAAVMATTDIKKLVNFTGYSQDFISVIVFNMKWNKIWSDTEYYAIELSRWFSPAELVTDKDAFWEHMEIACACLWMPGVESLGGPDPCAVYWSEKKKALGLQASPTGSRMIQ